MLLGPGLVRFFRGHSDALGRPLVPGSPPPGVPHTAQITGRNLLIITALVTAPVLSAYLRRFTRSSHQPSVVVACVLPTLQRAVLRLRT